MFIKVSQIILTHFFSSIFVQRHEHFVRQIKIIENHMHILSYDVMGHFHLWRAEDGTTLKSFDRHALTFILSTDCHLLVTARGDNWYN